jgi:hypothetical protein
MYNPIYMPHHERRQSLVGPYAQSIYTREPNPISELLNFQHSSLIIGYYSLLNFLIKDVYCLLFSYAYYSMHFCYRYKTLFIYMVFGYFIHFSSYYESGVRLTGLA